MIFKKEFNMTRKKLFGSEQEVEKKFASSKSKLDDAILAINSSLEDLRDQIRDKQFDFLKPLEIVGNLISTGLIVCDQQGHIIISNDVSNKMFGYETLINENIYKILEHRHDEKIQSGLFYKWLKCQNLNLMGTQTEDQMLLGVKRNDERFYLNIASSSYPTKDGGKHFILLVDDVSVNVEKQIETLSLVKKYQSLTNAINLTSNFGIAVIEQTDEHQKIVYCNEGFSKITGYFEKMTHGGDEFFLIGAKTDIVELENLRNCLKRGLTFQGYLKCYKPSGEDYIGNVKITKIENSPNSSLLSFYIEDVTARHNTVLELKRKIRILEYLEQIASVGWWTYDIGNKKVIWSNGTYDIHDLKPEEYSPDIFSALTFYKYPASREKIKHFLQELVNHQDTFSYKAKIITAKGIEKTVYVKGTTLKYNGDPLIVYGIISDLSFKEGILDKSVHIDDLN